MNFKDVHLLTFHIHEPLPGAVLPEMAALSGEEEAARRYRAIVLTTMRQMRGLANTRLRLRVTPGDGEEAVRFWLLPLLADHWQRDGSIFRTDGWEIDFQHEGGDFNLQANGEILCPNLSARWVHAGLLGIGRTVARIIGPALSGGTYFHAEVDADLPERILPTLPLIQTDEDWHAALDSPLGAALKKAHEADW